VVEAAPLATGPEFTVDAFLGGRVEAVQPARAHHRSGLEAVLLGASLATSQEGLVVDLGSGAGVAGFIAAARCPGVEALLVERDPALLDCARDALARPANATFAPRIRMLAADVTDRERLTTEAGRAAVVLINPPFNDATSTRASPDAPRAAAHALPEGALNGWLAAAVRLLGAGGRVTVIFRADGLPALLEAVTGRFGGLDILPIHARAGKPAHRVIVSGTKGSRAPLRILPPLVIHGDAGNAFRPEVDRILRDGAGLAEAAGPWQGTA
jgi:tRNA1(Val) A37 N6-methylase TrmN6